MPRPRPPKSDLEKSHDAARQKRDFQTVGYTARREEAAEFKAYCERRGQTVHAVLRAYVTACIAEDPEIAQGANSMELAEGDLRTPASPPTETPSEHKDTPEGK